MHKNAFAARAQSTQQGPLTGLMEGCFKD